MQKIKVLIVDDSAVVRQTLKEILDSDPAIEVMAVAENPFSAANKMKKELPDVITLDIEMPKMDGLTFLEKIMGQHPIPVVICSSLAGNGSASAMQALQLGAVEIIAKPKMGTKVFLEESKMIICDAVKGAALSKPQKNKKIKTPLKVVPKYTADAILSESKRTAMIQTTDKIIAVGASTGGTEALLDFLVALPMDSPGIAVVQHMPENFTKSFAERLNEICAMEVMEAKNNDTILRGRVLIAPGNKHMLVKRSGARYYVEVKDGPLVNRHRPSVDVLFRATSRYAGSNAIGVILTGMGDDGARGMLEMKNAGSFNYAQDEKSCVVFGMPKEAIKLGGVDKVLPLDNIAPSIISKLKSAGDY